MKFIGGTVAGGALLGGATSSVAADEPPMTWEPADTSNYSSGNRTASDIRWVVFHTIEGSAGSAINWFQNPDSDVSSHFVVDSNGDITKMVAIEDVAWTNGNGPYNDTGINIELEGYADETDFTEAMYEAVADLTAYLCDTYGVAVRHPTYDIAPCSAYDGEGGLIGHEQIPSPYDCSEVTGGKTDPGSTWNWDYLLGKIDGGAGGGAFAAGDVVKTSSTVNVRSEPTIGQNVVHTNPSGVRGVVKDGPTSADGYTWWKVAYENGEVGWSVQQYLTDQVGVEFLHDQRVKTTTDLNVRSDASVSASKVWTAPSGSAGYARAGPKQADGYLWWKVAFNSGQTGWCVEEYLDAAPVEGHGVGHGEDSSGGDGDDGGDTKQFAEGDVVHSTTSLNTRKQPGTGSELVDTLSSGSSAEIVNGPVDADGYTWWGLHWQAENVWGWSVEKHLAAGEGDSGGAPVSEITIETDLTEPVDVTGAEIDDAIAAVRPNSPLVGLGDTFVAVQEAYSVNALYQAAHAIHESAWGTSTIAQDKRNLFGWGAADSDPYGGAKRFDSFEDCVWYVMEQVEENYLSPGDYRYNGPTLDGMNVYYASDDAWAEKIRSIYNDYLVANV